MCFTSLDLSYLIPSGLPYFFNHISARVCIAQNRTTSSNIRSDAPNYSGGLFFRLLVHRSLVILIYVMRDNIPRHFRHSRVLLEIMTDVNHSLPAHF